jgi:DNA helicase HerA-like ATPase
VSQNPLDIPDVVLGQLGNRVQHALRAFTPRDQKAVQSAAETFRANPNINVATAITELGVGEALVSFLATAGTPGIVERAFVCPPHAQIGPVTPDERRAAIQSSPFFGKYENEVDRESAYEILMAKAQQASQAQQLPPQNMQNQQMMNQQYMNQAYMSQPNYQQPQARGMRGRGILGGLVGGVVSSASRSIGGEIARGILGSIIRR